MGSSKDVDDDVPISNEYEPISNKAENISETPVVDESVERRKKKRRDRRKTNSESSCTKVEIPQFLANDDVEISNCDNNKKYSDKKSSKQDKEKIVENTEGQEETEKEVNKNRDTEVSTEAQDLKVLSVASKPKVVVPSPPGIPRPKPINKRETNRDSMVSDDGFFMDENSKTEKSGSVEETEEFKKAVESFDQIYLLESGNGSPEISSNRSSISHAKKLTTSAEDTKADLSPNTAWKKLKTAKSIDASESSSNGNESSDNTKFQLSSEMNTGNQKSSTKHEMHNMITKTECTTQSTISESNSSSYQSEKKAGKSFDASKSNINGSESSDIKESQISSEMNIGTQKKHQQKVKNMRKPLKQ